jgi:hypothetical protein
MPPRGRGGRGMGLLCLAPSCGDLVSRPRTPAREPRPQPWLHAGGCGRPKIIRDLEGLEASRGLFSLFLPHRRGHSHCACGTSITRVHPKDLDRRVDDGGELWEPFCFLLGLLGGLRAQCRPEGSGLIVHDQAAYCLVLSGRLFCGGSVGLCALRKPSGR